MENLRLGDPLDKSTDIGAIVADVQLERIRAWSSRAGGGQRLLAGQLRAARGRRLFLPADPVHLHRPGFHPRQRGDLSGRCCLHDFRTQDEAIALANNSRYGLAASVWSENINVTLDAAARGSRPAWSGSTPPTCSMTRRGFGGYKESGFGRKAAARALRILGARWDKKR
jgi:aldehyde dehydrogenase (NAD+)